MEWEYKKITITINEDGFFYFTIKDKTYSRASLEDAKDLIDFELKHYYMFKASDINNLCKKLNERESEFVKALIKELKRHESNAYCEMGILDEMLFKF